MNLGKVLRLGLASTVASGAVVLLDPAAAAGADLTATLVATRLTSTWPQPSPDPSGIAWTGDHLVISDPEIDEIPARDRGTSLFSSSLTGEQLTPSGGSLDGWSEEPAGLGYFPGGDVGPFVPSELFVADDEQDRIFRTWPGVDGAFGTADDRLTSFAALPLGTRFEDVAVDLDVTRDGHLLLVDGPTRAVFEYAPGLDDRFGTEDDVAETHLAGPYGALHPSGIAYHPTRDSLLVLDPESRSVYELTRQGALLNRISTAAIDPVKASGVAVAPASDGSGAFHLYVVDSGVDNNADPTENDGRFYELSVPW